MSKGKEISVMEILRYVQTKKGWTDRSIIGEDVIRYSEFQSILMLELEVTSNVRRCRELWKVFRTSVPIKTYNTKLDTVIVYPGPYCAYIDGILAARDNRIKVTSEGATA